jgi:pseudouridine-5'-monophosphatase
VDHDLNVPTVVHHCLLMIHPRRTRLSCLSVDSYLAERNATQDALWHTVRPLPGVLKLVKHLHSHGIPIAIATTSTRSHFVKKPGHLEELYGLFEGKVIYGDDMTQGRTKGKPWPDIYIFDCCSG